jgi:aryl-alcohol dehydrogenase-like predicted oxidoreductase
MTNKKIILGTVQMGLPYGINNTSGQITYNESHLILKEAFKNGIRILDTAEGYGNAHEIIGDFHRANPEMIFKIVTKIPPSDFNDVEKNIDNYLKTLHVNQLEGLLFHAFKYYKDHRDEIGRLSKLKQEGLFKQLGVSVYTNEEIKELISDPEIDLIQLPFNLLDNFSLRGKLMEEAKRKGKTIHTRSAFLQGLFFKNPSDNHSAVRSLRPQLLKIQEIVNEQKISISSLALSYCLQQSAIDHVLIGVDAVEQLKKNLKDSGFQMSEKMMQAINEIKTENIDLLNPSLWH